MRQGCGEILRERKDEFFFMNIIKSQFYQQGGREEWMLDSTTSTQILIRWPFIAKKKKRKKENEGKFYSQLLKHVTK